MIAREDLEKNHSGTHTTDIVLLRFDAPIVISRLAIVELFNYYYTSSGEN